MKEPRRPVRVLFVIGTAEAGGAERQLVRLACELRNRGVDASILLTEGGGPLTKVMDAGHVPWEVLFRHGPSPHKVRSAAALVRLAMRLKSEKPNIVFAWLGGAIWKTLPLASVLTRAKRIAAFRGEVHERDFKHFARVLRRAVSRADAVTVNTPSLRAGALTWGAMPDRISHISNGVDLPSAEADVAMDPPTAVVVANFRWYKGHDVLIDALAKVTVPLRVRLAGEGTERTPTAARAVQQGIDVLVEFVDVPADVAAELGAAQFAIHPSRTEGLSNAILEELSYGLPVVATDVGGTSLLVEDGVNGFLVPAGDEVALAKRIEELARSPELRRTMSVAARQKVSEFGWKACTDAYLKLFDDLLAPGRPAQ